MKRFFTLLLPAACCWLISTNVQAQVVRNYGLIFSDNVKGGHTMFGNTSVAAHGFYDSAFRFSQPTTLNTYAMNDFNTIYGRDTVYPGGATSMHANDYYNILNVDIDANLSDITLMPASAKWFYHNDSTTPAGWPATTHLTGTDHAAALGFNTTGLATTISDLQTHYFVQTLSITDSAQFKDYLFTVRFDAGFVVYVNGVEVKRLNMPAGAVSYGTPALVDSSGTHSFAIAASAFREGANTIQVEMHRFESAAGGDMLFSLDLKGRAVTTYNSSSSDLVLPAGTNNILFARLYWGAKILTSAATDANLRSIKLRKGNAGKYTTFVANGIDRSNEGTYSAYQAYTDITAFVKANNAGTYTVANVPVTNGMGMAGGGFGGWTIVVAYENTAEPFRSVRIYDGYLEVENNGQHSITLSNLNVPNNTLSHADAYMSAMAWEGDANLAATAANPAGDFIKLNNITVFDSLNPATNFWNGTISKNGHHVTTKFPNYRNQISLDIDEMQVGTGYGINPGATSIPVQFGTERDQYYPSLFAFSILMKDPSVTINKTVDDINGGMLALNDTLLYTLSGTNTGAGTAYNVIVTDELPNQLQYIANSLEIKNNGTWQALTTASVTYNSSTSRYAITAYIGTGATTTEGGELAPQTGSYELRFRARVTRTGTVTNTGVVTARNTPTSSLTYESFVDESTVDISSPVALPITMGRFGGSIQSGIASLQWVTLTEQNTLRFELERSTDGQHFSLVGAVKAQGNSNVAQAYNQTDALSAWGGATQAYYRVKTIDIDGKIWYSKVIVLAYANAQPKSGLTVFPNPILTNQASRLQVSADKAQTATVQVVSSNGLIVKMSTRQLRTGSNVFTLDEIANLKAGIYFINTTVDGRKLSLHIQVQ